MTSPKNLNRTFFALSDATRRAILERLALGEATVGELAEPFGISRPATSKHLNVLEDAGLIHRTRDGRVNRCSLDARPLQDASTWVAYYQAFWESQLDGLQRYFEEQSSGTDGNQSPNPKSKPENPHAD